MDFVVFCSNSPNMWLLLNFLRVSSLIFLEVLDSQCIFLHIISCFQAHTNFTPSSCNSPLQLPLLSEPPNYATFPTGVLSQEKETNHVGSHHPCLNFISKYILHFSKGWNWVLSGVLLIEPHCSKEGCVKGKQNATKFCNILSKGFFLVQVFTWFLQLFNWFLEFWQSYVCPYVVTYVVSMGNKD